MNEQTEKSLKVMLAKMKADTATLRPHEHMELEVRFKNITKDVFQSVYSELLKSHKPMLENTINIISNNVYELQRADGITYLQTIGVADDKLLSKLKTVYSNKQRIGKPVSVHEYMKYSVGLSKEAPNTAFSTKSDAMMRFKIRASFTVSPQWRYDLTVVKQGSLRDFGANIKSIKEGFFVPMLKPNTFIESLKHESIDAYEIELEWIGADIPTIGDITAATSEIFAMVNPAYLNELTYQDELVNIAERIEAPHLQQYKTGNYKLKQLANQAIALTKYTYYNDIYPPEGYLLTIKADGERVFAIIDNARIRILSNTLQEFTTDAPIGGGCTIVDCELMDANGDTNDKSKANGESRENGQYLRIFDVLMLDGKGAYNQGLAGRIEYIPAALERVKAFPQLANSIPAEYVTADSANLEASFRAVWDRKYDYPNDGIMMSEPAANYQQTRNYKWKPLQQQTIDFVCVLCPQNLLGILPYVKKPNYDLYLLFVGISESMRNQLGLEYLPHYKQMFGDMDSDGYYPIQFSPSANPLAYLYYHPYSSQTTGGKNDAPQPITHPCTDNINKQIIELSRMDDQWVFHRMRTDRQMSRMYFGNDFRTAELTYTNYIDPFHFEDLFRANASYFSKSADSMHSVPNKYKRYVISTLLKNNLANSKWIIDQACGRGADLFRYPEINCEHALFIDVDPTAIAELIGRKFSTRKAAAGKKIAVVAFDKTTQTEYDKVVTRKAHAMTIHTLVADLKEPESELVAKTYQFGINPGMINGIVCNFALHYMCDTIEHLRNLLIFNARMLRVGGLFMFTVMDGAAVFALLKDFTQGQSWEVHEDGVLKYAIRKDYRGDKLAPTGQMIAVKLPFSQELVPEPLCNVQTVITEAARLGLEVELNDTMGSMLNRWAHASRDLHGELTHDDMHYIGLYKYVSLRKIKDVKI